MKEAKLAKRNLRGKTYFDLFRLLVKARKHPLKMLSLKVCSTLVCEVVKLL